MSAKRDSLRVLLREVGAARFEVAITQVIAEYVSKYMPPTSVIREYAPEGQCNTGISEAEWKRLREDRQLHPENYFGTADVICMMRAQASRLAAKEALYTTDELFRIIELARQKYGVRYSAQFIPKGGAQ